MTEPRFSVIIPLRNKARHVPACLASALGQSYPPEEVIVVDDNSSDGSAEIVADTKSPLIRLFHRDMPGPGGYAARNLGIAQARGDWIAFLDADDIWYPDHLADIAKAIRQSPGAGCVATRYLHVYDDHSTPSNLTPALASIEGRAVGLAEFLRLWLAGRECPIWTGASAFRKSVLQSAGLFPAGQAVRGGDKDLWLRAVASAPFTYVSNISAEFNRDSDNKVSHQTVTDTLPIIVDSARRLMDGATSEERALLRRLVNQQIGLYARFAFKGDHIPASFGRNLYMPEGIGMRLLIEGLRLMPMRWRHAFYHSVKSTRSPVVNVGQGSVAEGERR